MKNENMEFAGMELTLTQKNELHQKLLKILKAKLASDPENQFLLESLAAEQREWAKIEPLFKSAPEAKQLTLRKMF